MSKLKTHSGAKKRFLVRGSGKIMHRRVNRNHILTKKAKSRLRRLATNTEVSVADLPRIEKLLNVKVRS